MNKAETKDPHSKDLIFNKVPNKDKNQPLLNNKTKPEIKIIKIEEDITTKDNKEIITTTEATIIKIRCSSNNMVANNKIETVNIQIIDNKEDNNKTITTTDNKKVVRTPKHHNNNNNHK